MKFNRVVLVLLLSFGWGHFSLTVTPTAVYQGNSFKVAVSTNIGLDGGEVQFLKKSYPLYKIATHNYETLLGVSYQINPGSYPLRVRILRNQKQIRSVERTVTVNYTKFRKAVLTISPETEAKGATDFAVLNLENSKLGKVLKVQRSQRFWWGKFLRPLKIASRVSSPYGAQRLYKNLKGKIISEWTHRGVDYGVPVGTAVRAANSGVIVMAQMLQVHGGTIVIDHGQGIHSIYNHLGKILVKKGDWVSKGKIIAYSGNTGLTTGAHLHYGLSVNNTRVNPWEWFERGF